MHQLVLPDVTSYEPEDAKQRLRSAIRSHRKERSEAARIELARQCHDPVMRFVEGASRVGCFVSVNAEPPTYELCALIADSGKELLLPKLGPRLTRSWGFFRGLDDLQQMAPGRPPEPSGPAFDNDILASVDVLIIPALAVSHAGERLGQGGGWYDRALKAIGKDTKVLALIYPEEYVTTALPQDEMDMPVPYVVTADGIFATTAAHTSR